MTIRPESDGIICIGTADGIEVNFYLAGVGYRPTIEIMSYTGRVTLTPAQIQGVVDLLAEAEQFWLEEGRHLCKTQD